MLSHRGWCPVLGEITNKRGGGVMHDFSLRKKKFSPAKHYRTLWTNFSPQVKNFHAGPMKTKPTIMSRVVTPEGIKLEPQMPKNCNLACFKEVDTSLC